MRLGTGMKRDEEREELEAYFDDLRSTQGQSTWPKALKGGKAVDEFLIRGNRNAPMVQRVELVSPVSCSS
jgi:hypothetical protein